MNLDKYTINSELPFAYSIIQISRMTSISKSMIWNQIRSGNLKIFHCGRRALATPQAVKEWIEMLSSSE